MTRAKSGVRTLSLWWTARVARFERDGAQADCGHGFSYIEPHLGPLPQEVTRLEMPVSGHAS